MYRILTASRDTYITDKIVNSSFRATDANVGQAGTLDLFKLYGETRISGSVEEQHEISRILIKFDLDTLRSMTSSMLDTSHSSFKCLLHLSDVYGGQSTPTNFKVIVLPLSRSFDEGFGRDIGLFQDLDSANFVTASVSSGISAWAVTGANGQGLLGSSNIDVITSGVLTSGVENLGVTQTFRDGDEDLLVDVTRIVSATLAGLIPDHGFRISFSGSQETDNKTRFVKRFSSRHTSNARARPKIRVTFNDTIHDDHRGLYFDLSGSLFLKNTQRGNPANLLSGSLRTPLTGNNCVMLTLVSGTFSSSFTGSQHKVGNVFVTGMYSASFLMSSLETAMTGAIRTAGSATFTEVWSSLDRTVAYVSGTVKILSLQPEIFSDNSKRFFVNVFNAKTTYRSIEKARFRVFAQDVSPASDYKYTRGPVESLSYVSRDFFYRIRDVRSGDVIIAFDDTTNTTNMSTDKDGMYFDVYMDSLEVGRTYTIDVMSKNGGVTEIYESACAPFRIE